MTPQSMLQTLTRHRRTLHQIPEIANQEFKTQQYLLGILNDLNLDEVTPIRTGVKAVLRAKDAVSTLAFRSDIDALKIPEQVQTDWTSTHQGYMHACGHDGHMAILLGLCQLASHHRDQLRHNLVFIFQPAEEAEGGAQMMIEHGVLSDPPVDEVYGLHILPDLPLGQIGVQEGAVMAQNSMFDIDLSGKSAHGAMPHHGSDAVIAAASLIQSIYSNVLRGVNPSDNAVVTVGKMNAGTVRNIVADFAHLECICRTFSEEVNEVIMHRLEDQLRGLQAGHGVSGTITPTLYYPPVINAPIPTQKVREAVGQRAVGIRPMLIAEDFSFYQKQVPGCYFFVGSGTDQFCHSLHSPLFDFDEQVLVIALAAHWSLITGATQNQ